MRYSIELVPRSWDVLQQEVEEVTKFNAINTLNIPDLLRFDIRSWDACEAMTDRFEDVIPHLRAIDFDLKNGFPLTAFLKQSRIRSVLVVEGDPPQDISHRTYRNTSCELIRIIKKELPDLKVYAAIDQYRTSMRKELDYIHDKIDAGVDGFFTQPFFDLKLLELYMDMLDMDLSKGIEVFWGMSPVHTLTSQSYWENKNDVVFPSHFEPTKEWNIAFGRDMLEKIKARNDNVYFMPIRASATEYLAHILEE